ncbi:Transcriptional adapter ada2 [Chytridiales sp. JEL 0842]|nr:Transcriptional adapter ada2 [Chytridiales sp. JEL 0842]
MTFIVKENSTADDDFTNKYHCDACEKDISNVVRITCAECKNEDMELDLCVDCFAAGTEVKGHKRTHKYMVKEALDYPLFDKEWTAQEELQLVDSLKTFGIGNWEQIAECVGTKTKYEVAEHYQKVYVDSETWPLPNMTLEFDKSTSRKFFVRDPNPPVPKPLRTSTSGPANHEIQGFMPAREEFEHEFDQDAETTVKDMVFEDTELPEEIKLKTTILNIYNTALDRRMERKKFLFDRGLTHDFRKVQSMERKRSKEEKDLFNRTRVFAKMQTAADFEQFMDGLLREQQLRARIAELQEFRRMGIQTFREAEEYTRDKTLKHMNIKNGLRDMTGATRLATKTRYEPYTLNPPTRAGSVSSNIGGYAGSRTGGTPPPSQPPVYVPPVNRKGGAPLDISNSDGVDLLLSNEKQLCANLRILPRAYLVIKETLLREYAAKGILRRRTARQMIKIDVNKTSQIYDLFVANGWITFST